jgi:hypothetical protein
VHRYVCIRRAGCPLSEGLVPEGSGDGGGGRACPAVLLLPRPGSQGPPGRAWLGTALVSLVLAEAEPGAQPGSLLSGCQPVPASRPNACVLQAGHCARRPRVGLLQNRGVVARLALRFSSVPDLTAGPPGSKAGSRSLKALCQRAAELEWVNGSLLPDPGSVPCLDRRLRRARSSGPAGFVSA